MLFSVISGCIAEIMNKEFSSLKLDLLLPWWPIRALLMISGLIPPSYAVLLVLAKIVPSDCSNRAKRTVLWNMIKIKFKTAPVRKEQALPVLISSEGPNYQTFLMSV